MLEEYVNEKLFYYITMRDNIDNDVSMNCLTDIYSKYLEIINILETIKGLL